jgi:hypothetical protein
VHTELPLDAWQTVYVVDGHSEVGGLMRVLQATPTEDGASTILNAVQPSNGQASAEAKLKDIKAVLVQLQDVFVDDGSAA